MTFIIQIYEVISFNVYSGLSLFLGMTVSGEDGKLCVSYNGLNLLLLVIALTNEDDELWITFDGKLFMLWRIILNNEDNKFFN